MDNARNFPKLNAAKKSNRKLKSAKLERETGDSIKVADGLEEFYNNLPLTCFIVDESGGILSLNAWGVSQLGYTTEELHDRKIFSLIYWPDIVTEKNLLGWLSRSLKSSQKILTSQRKSAESYLGHAQGKNGEEFCFKTIAMAIPSKNKKGKEICLICQDVTDFKLKRPSQSTVLEGTLVDGLMQMSKDLILCVDSQGKILRFSNYFTDFSGYKASELQEQNILNIWGKSSHLTEALAGEFTQKEATIQQILSKIQEKKIIHNYFQPILCKDGSQADIYWTIQSVNNAEGNKIELLWVGQHVLNSVLADFSSDYDIEEINSKSPQDNLLLSLQILKKNLKEEMALSRVETALKKCQDRLNLIINTNGDGTIVLDKQGNIRFVNPAAAAIFGRKKKDLLGKSLGCPITTDEITELEILLPNGKIAIAEMQVVQIPWTELQKDNNEYPLSESSRLKGKSDNIAYLGSLRDVTDRKQKFERLIWMQQAIESASDAIAITDWLGRVIYQNRAFSQLFEYQNCQEINQWTSEWTSEQIYEDSLRSNCELQWPLNILRQSPLTSLLFTNRELADEVLEVVRNGESWQGEVTMQSQTGKIMQISLKADAIENESREILGLICTYTDVTEHRQAEEMLRQSLAQNQAMFKTIPDSLFRVSADGTYLDCGEGAEFPLCKDPGNCIGQNTQEILPPFLAQQQMAAIADALVTKKVQVFEYQLVLPGKDGENRLYDYEARAIAIDDHEVSIVVRDVTEKAEIQRSLLESEERYRSLAETSQDMIFIFNRDASIHYVNIFAAHKLGTSPGKLVGRSIKEIVRGSIVTELESKIYQVLRDKKQATIEQKIYLYNVPIWLHFSLVPLNNENGTIVAVLAVARDITERIEAEAALKESQEKLGQSEQQLMRTLATAPIGITTCDLSGHFQMVNPALCQMLGYLAVDLRKISLSDLVHPRDRSEFQAWISRFQTNKTAIGEQEQSLIRQDGREIIATIRVALIRDSKGNPQEMVATIEDITDRKRSQEQLLLLSKAVESASDAIAITDANGRSTYHNPAFIELFGFSTAALAKVGGPQILYQDAEIAHEVFDTIIQQGSWQGEVEMLNVQGLTRQIFLRTNSIKDTSGEIVAFLGVYRDITDRKQAMDALAESEERFRTLADTAPVLIWLADANGRYTFFNQTWLQFTGRSSEEELGLGWMSQIHPEDFQSCVQQYLLAVETSVPFRLLYRLRRVDGEYRWLLNTGVPSKTPCGTVAGYIGSCIDISDRKQLEEQLKKRAKQLEQSNTELEQFAYVASHDLQEPLRTTASYTQLLAKRYQGKLDAKADKYINYVVDGVHRMQTLIEDLLKYSRVSTRGQEFQRVNCQEIFERAISNFKIAIRKADATVSLDPTCESLPPVMGDETQLLQLFQNLISNAIKYRRTYVKPIVQVAAQRQDDGWLFSVQDNGIGIEEQHRDRIFLIFQRLHTREEYSGTGIGLAVCHKIVERHQGRIWVESQLGQGSTFYFTIPER